MKRWHVFPHAGLLCSPLTTQSVLGGFRVYFTSPRHHALTGGRWRCAGSFITLQKNAGELLAGCGMATPTMCGGDEYLRRGPSYMVWLHPALGPLWDVIHQKITGGRLAERAELSLELAEVALENVTVRTRVGLRCRRAASHGRCECGEEQPGLTPVGGCGAYRWMAVCASTPTT
jgi:hypothetical protein